MTPKSQMNASWYADPSRGSVPNTFNLFQEQFLKPLGKPLGKTAVNIEREKESAEYGAVRFEMDGQTCLFRQAKHTPKKVGQFAALWKRPAMSGEIAPFDYDDGIDKVIILAEEHPRFGVFVFPCRLLVEKDIFSEKSIGGKRAFRVYAPWVMPSAAQAKRAKIWQCAHFAELTDRPKGWRN
ncbi:MepB family protein [Neisseria oralis]|uniref:MepB family protein n=1 Tax=Neisseria oralis TaxID=1107316 RepID=UPI0027E4765D|nr:MepB family protein [Neisseria oralis]